MGTINVNGLGSVKCEAKKFLAFLKQVEKWIQNEDVNLVCIQEHNLDPLLHELYMRYAIESHMHLVIGYSKTTAHRGGTLIISDEKTIPHVEDLHKEPSMVVARYSFNGKNMDIASVYAPSDSSKRLDFFSHMNQHLTRYTSTGR